MVYSDASDKGIGAVLVQSTDTGDRPICFLSHTLNKTQQRWSIVEKEAWSALYAVEKWRTYLEGRPFTLYSDSNPLKFIDSAQNKNAKLARWACRLSAFGAGQIEWIPGKLNCVADALSRLDGPVPELDDTAQIEDNNDIYIVNTDRLDKDDLQFGDDLDDIPPDPPVLDPKFKLAIKQ